MLVLATVLIIVKLVVVLTAIRKLISEGELVLAVEFAPVIVSEPVVEVALKSVVEVRA